jgi:hypothetical protein
MLFRQTYSVGDLEGKFVTDKMMFLHQQIIFVNKIIKYCSVNHN